MTQEEKTQIEERIVDVLKTVYDPEIPVNIYDLGMIYKIDVQEDYSVDLEMTFTAPNCPAADYILEREPRLRAGLGPVDDERRGKSGIRIRLKVKK